MKYLNYILIALGAAIAIYANTNETQNQYVLIGGIMLLMIGVYRISKTVPSRAANTEDEADTDTHND